jgi:hypothetical protein
MRCAAHERPKRPCPDKSAKDLGSVLHDQVVSANSQGHRCKIVGPRCAVHVCSPQFALVKHAPTLLLLALPAGLV